MEHMNWVDLSMNVDNDLRSIKLGRGMEHYKYALVWARVFLKKERMVMLLSWEDRFFWNFYINQTGRIWSRAGRKSR